MLPAYSISPPPPRRDISRGVRSEDFLAWTVDSYGSYLLGMLLYVPSPAFGEFLVGSMWSKRAISYDASLPCY